MNAEHERLKEILAEAAGKETVEARAAYLDATCQGNPGLRQQVEGLLTALEQAGDFLEQSVIPPEAQAIGEGPGSVIGRYKLLEEIGEGGFGRVFMAEQTEPVHRKVALKIIKAGMDTREVIARFEAERQALALMDHPNIARVLDAGATASGRPYFVMELVRGIPLTEYCDQVQLPTAGRLGLFMKVCAAVQHAHQKGIIHRDLKPTNILVTVIDGEAVPKVIDFGVAKALGQHLTEKTLFTSLVQMVGTPAYMSPEQAELGGVDVDTRSDIYSLGVLLYELLTGVTPFDAAMLRQDALDEIRRVIRESEPPKPSTRLHALGGMLPEVAQRHHTEPEALAREVRGDLDWIAMKCLEKDRARRYETASNLAQDIERYLHHEPVTAAAPGALYRIGKFIRRHRFGMTTAAALVTLLVAGVVVSTWQAVRATRAEKEARTMAAFLEEMLNSVKPEEAKGKDTTLLRQMLDKAAARVDTELKSQPLTEAWLRDILGGVYLALGEYPKAEPMFRRTLEVRKRTLGREHPDTLVSLNRLAILLFRNGDSAEAEALFRQALEAGERTLGKDHPNTLDSVNGLGGLLEAKSDYAGAEALFRRALEAGERTLGKEHASTLGSVNNLALVLEAKGDYAGAESLYGRAMEACERTLGKVHPETLASVNGLALVLQDQGDFAGAEPLCRQALEACESTFGKDHPDTLISLNNLASLLKTKGDLPTAEPLFRRLLETSERTLGEDHSYTVSSVNNLAGLLCEKGDYAEAEQLYRRALDAWERTVGREHPHALSTVNNLATLLHRKGDYAGAEPLYRQALAAQELILGKDHLVTLGSVNNLAALLVAKGDSAGAEPLYRRAMEAGERALGTKHPSTMNSVSNLAVLLFEKGDCAGAEPLYRRALEASERTPTRLLRFAYILLYQGKYPEAEAVLRETLAMGEKQRGDEQPGTAQVLGPLIDTLLVQGKSAEAMKLSEDAAADGNAESLGKLAWLLATGIDPQARDGARAVEIAEKAAAANNRKDPKILDSLAAAYAATGRFTNAITVQTEAIALPQDEEQKLEIASRLRVYESGIPYRDDRLLAERAHVLLVEGKFAEAEAPAREGAALREKLRPDAWQTFNVRSLLGGSLLGQQKYAEAEPLLLSGYEGMKQREDRMPANGRSFEKEALQRLVQLYETTDRNDQAAEWKRKLAEFEQAKAAKPPATPPR